MPFILLVKFSPIAHYEGVLNAQGKTLSLGTICPDLENIDRPHVNEGQLLNQGQHFNQSFASGPNYQGPETSVPAAVLPDFGDTGSQGINEGQMLD